MTKAPCDKLLKVDIDNTVRTDNINDSSHNEYTHYHSKCRISVGIKMTLGKENKLSKVILWFDYLT